MYTLHESQRTLVDVQSASEGLDEAIDSLTEIAKSPAPPYPKHDIEQRANMGRNTMRRQLERAVQSQRDYEEKNAARLQEAREQREAETKKREEERLAAEARAAEEKRIIAEERYKMLETSRALAEKRAEEERRKEELEYTTDEDTGERVKRKKKPRAGGGKRKKKGENSDTEVEEEVERPRRKKGVKSATESSAVNSTDEGAKPKKRRKLARGGKSDKYKSSEMVVDSDEDGDAGNPQTNGNGVNGNESAVDTPMEDARSLSGAATPGPGDNNEEEEEEEEEAVARPRKKIVRRIEESDDDDDDDEQQDADEAAPLPLNTAEKAAAETEGQAPKRNPFSDLDVSMVDESVGAAGGGNHVTETARVVGEGYGEGMEGEGGERE